jgi:WD40 repeat protein
MSNKWAIEKGPLQAYASALLFSPASSLVRGLSKIEELNWITIKPAMQDKWSPCLQTLEGHISGVSSVAFSHDSARLASASHDKTVKLWDTSSGECLQTFEGHSSAVSSVAFSHDSARLASASDDKTVKLWDTSSGECLQTFKGHSNWVNSVAFSHDSARLASASYDSTVKLWDTSNSECLQTFTTSEAVSRISFDITDSYLHTDIGVFEIKALSGPRAHLSDLKSQNPQYKGLALSTDGLWITYNSENLVWLPPEYRPIRSAVSEGIIGVGVRSGRVWICRVV